MGKYSANLKTLLSAFEHFNSQHEQLVKKDKLASYTDKMVPLAD